MKKRGGKRVGSGRKPNVISTRSLADEKLPKEIAVEVLEAVDEKAKWLDFLSATTTTQIVVTSADGDGEPTRELITVPDYRIQIDAMKYLVNRARGLAPQAVKVEGGTGTMVLLIGEKAS